jgi:IS5 family transposase
LSDEQKTVNRTNSKIRSQVEHDFGTMTNEIGGICIRNIGRARAQVQISLLNLTDHIKRVAFLIRKKHWNFDRVIAPAAS